MINKNSYVFVFFLIITFVISSCSGSGDNNNKETADFSGPDENGVITFSSVTPGGYGELLNNAINSLPAATVSATLYLPADTSNPVPAVVIGLGSTGSGPKQADWAQLFNNNGIAAFVIDSYTPRQISNGQNLSSAAEAVDALFALKVLEQLSSIDSDRIAVLDFGAGMINTIFDEIRATVNTGGKQFSAYIVFYANCNIRQTSQNITAAPVLFLHGLADEWNSAAACENFVNQLSGLGADVTINTFADAHHGFDGVGSVQTTSGYLSNAQCSGEFNLTTRVLRNFENGNTFTDSNAYQSYLDGCRESKDMLTGGNTAARNQARTDVLDLLVTVFNL